MQTTKSICCIRCAIYSMIRSPRDHTVHPNMLASLSDLLVRKQDG